MLFASAGYNVVIYDKDDSASLDVLATIEEELHKLESSQLLRGDLSAEEQVKLISRAEDLETCVKDAFFVQVSRTFKDMFYNILKSFSMDQTQLDGTVAKFLCLTF